MKFDQIFGKKNVFIVNELVDLSVNVKQMKLNK